jgi:hypothetical protein
MDNPGYAISGMGRSNNFLVTSGVQTDLNKVSVWVVRHDNLIEDEMNIQIQVF